MEMGYYRYELSYKDSKEIKIAQRILNMIQGHINHWELIGIILTEGTQDHDRQDEKVGIFGLWAMIGGVTRESQVEIL